MERSTNSHKGDNGKVVVVGGDPKYHGAPIISALAAEKSGVDLVHLIVPKNQQHLARSFSLNVIVGCFSGKYLRTQDAIKIIELCKHADVLIIGNGLGEKPQTQRAIKKILSQVSCKVVSDAAALQPFSEIAPLPSAQEVVITPHHGEWSKIAHSNEQLSEEETLQYFSHLWKATIVLKGSTDLICSPDGQVYTNTTGHPILSKGGTGDVLAGLIGGLMAQGLSASEASQQACLEWGKVGEFVAQQKGLQTTLQELIDAYPLSEDHL